MRFKAKRSVSFFTYFGVTLVFSFLLVVVLPIISHIYFFGKSIVPALVLVIVLSICLWSILSIEYVFLDKSLFIKAGYFRVHFPYDNMTKVAVIANNFGSGLRVVSTFEPVIEIHYSNGRFKTIKVSPEDEWSFLEELKKRSPMIKVEL